MESGQSSHGNNLKNPMQLMLMDFCGNNLSGNDDPDHHDLPDQDDQAPHIMNLMEAGKSTWNSQAESLYGTPRWLQHQEASSHQNYAKFLLESSSSLLPIPIAAPPPSDQGAVLEGIPLPACGSPYDASGISDFHTDLSYNHYLGLACGSTSSEVDTWKLRLLMQHNEGLGNQFTSTQNEAQSSSSWGQNPNMDSSYTNSIPQDGTPIARVAPAVRSLSPAESRVSKPKTNMNDRKRRIRIHEKLNALQELLPHSGEGCQASVLDDVIDHVKFLQLKIKDLCKSRLEGESPTVPIIFREGYGHYFCDHQVLNEPLEEMVGKLLEQNPLRAMQLLETKGLLLLPIEFTQGLV